MDSNDYKELAGIATKMINCSNVRHSQKVLDYFEDMYYKQLEYETDMHEKALEEEARETECKGFPDGFWGGLG